MNKHIQSTVAMLALAIVTGCATRTTPIPPYLALPLAKANISAVGAIHYQNRLGQPISEDEFAAQYGRTRTFAMSKVDRDGLPDLTLRVVSNTSDVEVYRGIVTMSPGAERMPTMAAVADFRTCPRPEYPKSELRDRHTGTVRLAFLVTTDGYVKQAEIATSSGFPKLDLAAMASLVKCRFRPATIDGVPQERWSPVNYVWSIQ